MAELLKERPDDYLPELDWDRVAELALRICARADNHEVIRECHNPQHLREAKPAGAGLAARVEHIIPVERAHPRAWLCLQGCRGTIRIKLQQECPVAAAPLEDVPPAIAWRVPEIVLTWGDFGGQLSELAFNDFLSFLFSKQQILEDFAHRHVWELGRDR